MPRSDLDPPGGTWKYPLPAAVAAGATHSTAVAAGATHSTAVAAGATVATHSTAVAAGATHSAAVAALATVVVGAPKGRDRQRQSKNHHHITNHINLPVLGIENK
jgi:hypothetical protein